VAVSDKAALVETLGVQEEHVVGRDKHRELGQRKLQLPNSPLPHHWVKVRVRSMSIPMAGSPCSMGHGAWRAMALRANWTPRSRPAVA
jgi:hypothetical protein